MYHQNKFILDNPGSCSVEEKYLGRVKKRLSQTAIALLLACILMPALPAMAQGDLPVRPYVNPDEMIAFERSTPFQEAIQVLDTFSQEYEGKFIVDRTETSGPIGINLPAMHWEEALDLILNVKGLALRETEKLFEIVQPSALRAETGDGKTDRFRDLSGQQQAAAGEEGLLLDTKSKEVRISATFFEGSRAVLKELGVDWTTLKDGVVQVTSLGAEQVSQDFFSVDMFPQNLGNGISVDALFRTFENNNVGEILATPTIKVLDGQEGEVQVGQDIPILQRDFAGNTTTQLVQVGSILTVTPQVIETNDTTFIYMEIAAERSSGQREAAGLVINKQNAESEILLLDGESTVIAGLYSTQETKIRKGIPILKDLPPWLFGLRYLFGFNSTNREVRELIILIKAEIDPGIPERIANIQSSGEVFQNSRSEMARYNESLIEEGAKLTDDVEAAASEQDTAKQEAMVEEDTSSVDEQVEQPKDTLSSEQGRTDTLDQKEEMTIEREPYERDVETQQQEETDSRTFYVVGGAFADSLNAVNLKERLNRDGVDASIIKNRDRGYFYVIYSQFEDSVSAMKALEDTRQYRNSDAWLYKVRNR